MSFARIEDFKIFPVTDGPDNRVWVLWHNKAGAFELRVSLVDGDDDRPSRLAVVSAPELDPECNGGVGEAIVFHQQKNRSLLADVPDEAPAGGDGLLKEAIAALKRKYEASPLRLRPGRDPDYFRQLIEAAVMLAITQADYKHEIPYIQCSWNPDLPIRARLPETKADPTHIIDEIGEWFGAYATAGFFAHDDKEWDGAPGPAMLHLPEIDTDPTAHEVVAASVIVEHFYRTAAADFGIDEADIRRRMAILGCDGK